MREYIKKFNTSASADGYEIKSIPFTSTVVLGGGVAANLVCDEENKKIQVSSGGTIDVVDNSSPTKLYLSNGTIVELTGDTITSSMTSDYKSSLVKVEFGDDVTTIGYGAFYNFNNLSSVTISNSVANIEGRAFYGCKGLISITIPSGVTVINNETFFKCPNLTDVTFQGNITSIGANAFNRCTSLSSITIPNSVTSIGTKAFDNCTNLTGITLPSSLTSIGGWAFSYCKSLTFLTIPNGITTIGSHAFQSCANITSITIPSSVTSIEDGAFEFCNSVFNLTIPNSVVTIGNSAFYNVSNINYSGSATGSPWGARYANAYVDGDLLYSNSNKTNLLACRLSITNVTIPSSVTTIASKAFADCKGLTSITIPSSVTTIGSYAFYGCTSLSSVTIPSSVTNLDNYALFMGGETSINGSLQTITVGSTVYNYNGSEYFTVTLGNGTSVELTMWIASVCFLPDTLITLSDGTTKKVQDITYDDELKVWNFDEGHYDTANIAWLTKAGLTNNHYYQLTFSDGTILKTTGTNSNHKVYCTDTNKFEGVAYIEVGAHVFTENGIVTITDKQYVEEEVEYYNLITSQHFNCFTNGVLTSDRYGNIYPISNEMVFIKNGRVPRPYSEFESVNIDRYWYDNLRLGENTETLDTTKKYIMRLESQMRARE